MATIAILNAMITSDSTGLTRGLREAQTKTRQTGRRIQRETGNMVRGFRNVASSIVNVRTAIGVLAGSTGIGLLVRNQMRAIDQTAKFADMIGTTTQELTGLQHAAEVTAGVTGSQFQMALQRMTRRLAEAANGTGEAKDAIRQLGLSADELNRMGPAQAFRRIAGAMQDVENRGDRVRIAFKLFDSEGAKLVNTLNAGAGELDRLTQEAEDLGIAFDRIDAARVEAANDAITRMQAAMTGVTRELTIELSPYIQAVADQITEMMLRGRDFGQTFVRAIDWTTGAIGIFADGIHGIKILLQGAKLIGIGFGAAMISAVELATTAIVKFADAVNGTINDILRGFNKIPGVEIPLIQSFEHAGWVKAIRKLGDDARNAVVEERAALHDALMQPLPSQQIDDFMAAVRERAENAEIPDRGMPGLPTPGEGEKSATDAVIEQHKKRLESFRMTLMSERQAEQEHFMLRMEKLAEWRELGLIGQMEHMNLLEKVQLEHQNRLAAIDQKGAKERGRIEKQHSKEVQSMRESVYNHFAGLLRALPGESKAAALAILAIEKGRAIAETMMNTHVAAMRAIAELGPIAGPPAAAAIEAMGAVKVGLIAATGLIQAATMGGGASSSIGGGGGVGAPTEPPDVGGGIGAQEEPERRTDLVIRVDGEVFGRQTMERIADGLTELAEDGWRIGRVRIA